MWLLLTSCTGNDPTPVDTDAPPVEDDGWNLLQLGYHIGQALDGGLPSTEELGNAYLGLFEDGDGECPGDSTQLTGAVPPEGCAADSGAFYIGVSTWAETAEDEMSTWSVGGDFEMTSPDGTVFEGGGAVTVIYMGPDPGREASEGQVLGTWRWEGSTTGWADGVSGAYGYNAFPADGVLFLDGPVQLGAYALIFDELAWGPDCDLPTGGFSIRDPDANWYEVALDGCTGCGEAILDGEVLGELCPELDTFKSTTLTNLAR